ncbi:Glucose-6-phosphate 1-dehydrogenase [Tulasnella sp. JGI-2019a]|nr:Glucose-6-phosphate 1-dehydrogenase [Tulasnella sp. JGI-2019a]KAG9014463.1 Glucose-6-phosphate 1-dehydrogenase [Tulasnella sp. JGI-2019a]
MQRRDVPFAFRELDDNIVVVVIGASGDLARKKTFPALFGLFRKRFFLADIHIVGYARTKMDDTEYRKRITQYIKHDKHDQAITDKIEEFKQICTYISGSYDQDADFQRLEERMKAIESKYEG